MVDARRTLDPEAEERAELLLDGYALGTGFELAAVVGPSAPGRAEVARRLADVGLMVRVEPSGDVLERVEARLEEMSGARPVLWIECQSFDRRAWTAALSALNTDREWLRKHVPGLVVLAGPSEVLPMALERPDLGTMMGTVVRIRQDPVAVSPGTLTWLHLSDLHFSGTRRWERRNELATLLEHLRGLGGEGLRPDLVFVSGDIAQAGRPAEYDQAEDFFRQLMETLELDPRLDLFVVPGNHDVDRGLASKKMGRLLVADLLEGRSQEELEATFDEPLQLEAIGERLRAFYAFTHRLLGSARGWSAQRPWRADLREVRGLPVGVVQLNSAWACASDQDKGSLLIGRALLQAALDELPDARVKVALVHHPTSYLADFDESSVHELLTSARGVDFVLRGHLHETQLETLVGPGSHTTTHASGAMNPKSPWPRGCLITELDLAAGDGCVHLFGYSPRDGGHWFRDSGVYRSADEGRWEFELAPHLRAGRSAPEAAAGPSAHGESDAAWEARIAGYRAAAAAVNNGVSLLGLPEKSRRAPRTNLDALFAPLNIGPAAGVLGNTEGMSVEALLRKLLDRSFRAGMRAGEPPPAVRMVLLGDPGSGKTTLTRFLAVWAAGGVELDGLGRSTHLVPLRIPFREMNRATRSDLIGFLVAQSREVLSAPRDEAFFERLLEEGRALVLCDGLDEVPPTDRERTNQALLAFAARFQTSPVLVTSRVVGYDAAPLPDFWARDRHGAQHEGGFQHLRLLPLTDEGTRVLVERWYDAREPHPRERQRLVADLLERLDRAPAARQLARTPLLATLICLVHGQRATLPGQRAKLFEEVVDTLLHTWEEARGRRFVDIDAGRQRRYLEDLALQMQRERVAGRRKWSPEVIIERDALVAALTGIAAERDNETELATIRHNMQRWIEWLTARTGLLVEQRPGGYGFLHLSLMEYLAASALQRQSGEKLVPVLSELVEEAAEWWETVALVMGRRCDDPDFAAQLHRAFVSGVHIVMLLRGLQEEVDFTDAARLHIVSEAMSLHEPRRGHGDMFGIDETLRTVLLYSQRHATAVREAVVAQFESVGPDHRVAWALPVLPALFDAPEPALRLTCVLAPQTSDGYDLYWLWQAADDVGRRWPESTAQADHAKRHLFDHLAQPSAVLFDAVDTVHDGRQPFWCAVSPPQVTLARGYRISATPITKQQYQVFDPTWTFPHPALCPAVGISWYAAVSFCRWLSVRAEWARGARLPTEAEWEGACRAGTDTAFWSGDAEEDLARVGWYGDERRLRPHRVAAKRNGRNAYGLYDVHGNVWEWTGDWYDPAGAQAHGKAVRGGCYSSAAESCRSSARAARGPAHCYPDVGFRVLLPAL